VLPCLLVALAACGTADDRDAGSTRRDTSSSSSPAEPGPADGATGFYVPGELPKGWTISFQHLTNPWSGRCPCRTWTYRNEDGGVITAFTGADQGPIDVTPPEIVMEGGRSIPGGYIRSSGDTVSASWSDGTVHRGIEAKGVSDTTVEALARSWTAGSLQPPEGFDETWSAGVPAIEWLTELYWTISSPDGRSMVVHVAPWTYDAPPLFPSPDQEPVVLEGSGLQLGRDLEWEGPHFTGWWPGGADVTVAGSYGELNYSGTYLTGREMLDVAGGFRAVTADAWAAYVDDQVGAGALEACGPQLLGDRLRDLLGTSDGAAASEKFDRCRDAMSEKVGDRAAETQLGGD
jgi:hypothetical protein